MDNDTTTPDIPDTPDTPADDVQPAATDKPGRLFRMRSVIAVGLAGAIVGAAGGATVTALVDGDGGRHDRMFQQGGPGGHGERGEMPGMPPPGGMPAVPQDDSGDEQAPTTPGESSSS